MLPEALPLGAEDVEAAVRACPVALVVGLGLGLGLGLSLGLRLGTVVRSAVRARPDDGSKGPRRTRPDLVGPTAAAAKAAIARAATTAAAATVVTAAAAVAVTAEANLRLGGVTDHLLSTGLPLLPVKGLPVLDLGALDQALAMLDKQDVEEEVLATVVGLDEAEAPLSHWNEDHAGLAPAAATATPTAAPTVTPTAAPTATTIAVTTIVAATAVAAVVTTAVAATVGWAAAALPAATAKTYTLTHLGRRPSVP